MSRVLALVEGHTESAFVKEVLAPVLASGGVFLSATLLGKGGIRSYQAVRGDILAALKQDSSRFCTTMIDYYGLPKDWPGAPRTARREPRHPIESVEQAIADDIQRELGSSFDPKRFFPYLQKHEFEALLFSDPQVLAEIIDQAGNAAALQNIVNEAGAPEEIDDTPDGAPSKRLIRLSPGYQKVLSGARAATRIGIDRICECCPHFARWVSWLRGLATVDRGGTGLGV
ncbi:MAG: DUF4276 family protein [Planctomycetes bacterium]|nr:DUF4276 family protein [Planctomycetota bacterium]